jgi:hypothetical protein
MKTDESKDEWLVLEDNDPPPDLAREDAAFERERARLLREHPGKIAVLHGDEVVGVFDNANDAILEACRRFGSARLVFRSITEEDETAYIPNVDVNHPSFKRLDG